MSKHTVRSGDIAGLWARFSQLKDKVQVRTGQVVPIIVIQEAGLDGFWIHRLLQDKRVESYVVDPASIATSRRRRRAKTDKIDGEALGRALLAYKRGEPRVCAMVQAPNPHEDGRPRVSRTREVLTAERIQHVNRIKGLLFAQGIGDYEPLHRNRRERLEELITGDGRPLPECLRGKAIDRKSPIQVRGSGPHHWSALEALSSHLVLLIPSHRRLRHTCPSTSSRRRQPHARRLL